MAEVIQIRPYASQKTYVFYTVSIIGADVLPSQGTRASAPFILIVLNRNSSFPAPRGISAMDVLYVVLMVPVTMYFCCEDNCGLAR